MPDVNEIRLGSINGSHGIKGWVKVFSYTDPLEAILDYSPWILRKGGAEKEITVKDGHASGKRLIVQIEGVDTRDQAESLIGYEVHVSMEAIPDLEEGEFYWFQLEGLVVKNSGGEVLGKIDHMLETGANDVMVVKGDRERLIPFVFEHYVKSVSLEDGLVIVDWDPDF